jgi:hypothetical protein
MWPIKSSPGGGRTARLWSYGDGGSVMEVRNVRPLTSLPG